MLASAGGAIYEGVTYCVMSQCLTLGANAEIRLFALRRQNGQTLIFLFSVIRVYYEKLGHILKPLVSKCCPDLFTRLKDIAEKQVPAELKPIAACSATDAKHCETRCKIWAIL